MIRAHTPDENIERLLEALEPLAKIGDQYFKSGLDEHRPEWDRDKHKPADTVELYAGRGGLQLLTLADALKARELRNELTARYG